MGDVFPINPLNDESAMIRYFDTLDSSDAFYEWLTMENKALKAILKPYIKLRIGELTGFDLK